MKKLIVVLAMQMMVAAPALAANISNKDAEAHVIVVTENGAKSEMALAAGESTSFCPSGCFVTMPNGDRVPLQGSENVEIQAGKAVIR